MCKHNILGEDPFHTKNQREILFPMAWGHIQRVIPEYIKITRSWRSQGKLFLKNIPSLIITSGFCKFLQSPLRMSVQLWFMLLHRFLIFNSPYPVQMFRSKKELFLISIFNLYIRDEFYPRCITYIALRREKTYPPCSPSPAKAREHAELPLL